MALSDIFQNWTMDSLGRLSSSLAPASADGQAEGEGTQKKGEWKSTFCCQPFFSMKFPKLKRQDGFVMSHFFQEHAMIYGMWFVFKWAGYINRFLGLLWHGIQMSESRSWWPHGSSAIQDDPPCTPVSQPNPRVRTLLWSMKINETRK